MSMTYVCHDVAYNKYQGSIEDLAKLMNISSKQVLINKLNFRNPEGHYKLNVEEAARLADIADSDHIAKAFAERRNMICVPIVQHEGASDMEILDLVIRLNTAGSEFLEEMRKALADGSVTEKEMGSIRKEAHEHMAAIAELVSRIEGMVR